MDLFQFAELLSPEGVTVAQLRAAARNIREQLVLLDDRAQKPNADTHVCASFTLIRRGSNAPQTIDDIRFACDMLMFACLFGQTLLKADNVFDGIPVPIRWVGGYSWQLFIDIMRQH